MSITARNKGFTKDQINKIGNSIVYIAQNISDLSKTKILKILFLLEEASIKKYGNPFYGIDFQLWVRGPVVKDIFIDLSDESPVLLKNFIERDPTDITKFKAKGNFCDDEFSDNDINLMDLIIDFVKSKNAKYLVNHTHDTNSLWRKSAIKYGVLELLENELINSTEFEIDFDLLFDAPSPIKDKYDSSKENLDFIRALKS
ncbi:MAG TPA: Panacea domain-containing protein [Puia sp.]